MLHEDITGKIIKAYYNVYNTLGYGFLEKVYERALLIELRNIGLVASNQIAIKVKYNETIVGDYYADIIVEGKVIIENKAAVKLTPQDEAQLTNYLKATDIEVGILLNFGQEPEFKRKIFENRLKE